MIDPKILRAMADAGASAEEIVAAYEGMVKAKKEQGPRHIGLGLYTEVARKSGYRCHYCGTHEGPFHCDHVIPYSRGGKTSLDNLVLACKPCNSSKRDRTPEEWSR